MKELSNKFTRNDIYHVKSNNVPKLGQLGPTNGIIDNSKYNKLLKNMISLKSINQKYLIYHNHIDFHHLVHDILELSVRNLIISVRWGSITFK